MPALYEIRPSPFGGEGVFATQDIPPGTFIIHDPPKMTIPQPLERQELEDTIAAEFRLLSPEDQARFLRLHESSRPYETRLARIYKGNSFSDQEDTKTWVCFEISKINHACAPNASIETRGEVPGCVVLREVRKGEEVFICYRPDVMKCMARGQRRALIQSCWQFHCQCTTCSQSPYLTALSDQRRRMIDVLSWKVSTEEYQDTSHFYTDDPDLVVEGVQQNMTSIWISREPSPEVSAYFLLLAGLLEAEGEDPAYVAGQYAMAAVTLCRVMESDCGGSMILPWMVNIEVWMRKAISMTLRARGPESKEVDKRRKQWREIWDTPTFAILRAFASSHEHFRRPRMPITASEINSKEFSRLADPEYFELSHYTPRRFALRAGMHAGQPAVQCISLGEYKAWIGRRFGRKGKFEKRARRDAYEFMRAWNGY